MKGARDGLATEGIHPISESAQPQKGNKSRVPLMVFTRCDVVASALTLIARMMSTSRGVARPTWCPETCKTIYNRHRH